MPDDHGKTATNSAPAENVGIAETAAAVGEAIDRNAGLSEKPGTTAAKTGGEKWRSEPRHNFLTDASGELVMRNGRPVRRGGRPRKPVAGDPLAGGGVWGSDSPAASKAGSSAVVDPGPAADPGDPGPGIDPAPGAGETVGPEAGEVATDLLFNTVEAVGGDKAKPSNAERASIKRAASQVAEGIRVSPWLALLVLGLGYVVRVAIQNRKKKPADADSLSNRGADPFGQNADRSTPMYRYPSIG